MRISIFLNFSHVSPWGIFYEVCFDHEFFLSFLIYQVRRVPVPDARFDYLVEYHKPAR